MQSFDIIIVGAGIVGLVQALSLKSSGLRVAVIDSQSAPEMPSGEAQLRVSALTLATQTVLQNLGAWDNINAERISSYKDMLVWDKDSFAKISFSSRDVNCQQLGFIVENQAIQASLWQQAERAEFITVYSSCNISKLALSPHGSFVSLDDDRLLSSRLVIGADGANSLVRSQANFPLTFWDYDHTAIVATIKTQEAHGCVARQVFTENGPLAFLPLWDSHYCSIVWSQNEPVAQQLLALSNQEFNKALTVAFDGQLGLCELVSERRSYPLKMRYARKWVDEGVAIVGDAAHTIHPLAGQGVNLGIWDAVSLAEHICYLVKAGKDYAAAKNLRPYERWRKTEAIKMISAMEGFKRLFAGNHPIKKIIRDVGVSAINHWNTPKNSIIKQAMGLSGKLPDLANAELKINNVSPD